MLTGRPSPALDFDETAYLLRDLYLGQKLSVNVMSGARGVATIAMRGWCVRLHEIEGSFALVLRDDPTDDSSPFESAGQTLFVFRDVFEGAGEADMGEPLGPLAIGFDGLIAIVLGATVPDWESLRRGA